MIDRDVPPQEQQWQPLSVDEVREVFAPLSIDWWIAGGWAIDLYLGRQTREHADIDVSVLRGDHRKLRPLLDAFELHIAADGELIPWSGDELVPAHHQFWARRRDEEAWAFEILLEDHRNDEWLCRRDHRITLPLASFGRRDDRGLPYVTPEVALLYKAKHPDLERSAADFAQAAPALDDGAKAWLRDALAVVHPGHAWLRLLP